MNAGCLPGADSAFIFKGGGGIGERPWSLGDFTGEERMMECDTLWDPETHSLNTGV